MKTILITAIVTFILTTLGSYFTYRWNISAQKIISKEQRQQEAFSRLMGKKILIMQLYVSRFEAMVYSDYHEAKWKNAGYPNESLDMQEAVRWMHKSEDYAIEIAKATQSLFEDLGLIRILFPPTPELEEHINKLYYFKTPKILGEPFNMNTNELEEWKKRSVQDLQKLVKDEYGTSIDNLLDYLIKEINNFGKD